MCDQARIKDLPTVVMPNDNMTRSEPAGCENIQVFPERMGYMFRHVNDKGFVLLNT